MRTPQHQTRRLTRKEKIEIQHKSQKTMFEKLNFHNIGLSILFFTGTILTIFEINIYRTTIIDWKIPTTIWLFFGYLFYPITSKYLVKHYSTTGFFLKSIFNIFAFGGIFVYIFMASNYYLSNEITSEYRFAIKEKNSMSGGSGVITNRKPLITFDYFHSFEKELVFRYLDTEKINKADSVTVRIRKGKLGFDIIDSYNILN